MYPIRTTVAAGAATGGPRGALHQLRLLPARPRLLLPPSLQACLRAWGDAPCRRACAELVLPEVGARYHTTQTGAP